jgi:Tfp pilus assembly protein PilP
MHKIPVFMMGVFLAIGVGGGSVFGDSSIPQNPWIPKPAKPGPQTPSTLFSTRPPLPGPEPGDPPYDPTGIPDPFQPPKENLAMEGRGKARMLPLEQFEIGEYELVGIVSGSGIKKAMIQDMTGKGFLVTVGTGIGKRGGKIIGIGTREITVQEPYTDFLGRKKNRRVSLKIPDPF